MGLVSRLQWFATAVSFASTVLVAEAVLAVEHTVQTFSLDGQLFSDAAGTQPLIDNDIQIKVQILNPLQTCVLYEEMQRLSTASSNGYFSFRIGSIPGSSKRTSQDSGHTMAQVYSNTALGSVVGKSVTNASACTYSPAAGDSRYLRVLVTPARDGITRTLNPPMSLDVVPIALVAERAETFRGYEPSNFVLVSDSGTAAPSQANLETVFSTTNYPKLLDLLSGGAGYTDWYLPSKIELELVYRNSSSSSGFAFAMAYWSSTEQANNTAYLFNFIGKGFAEPSIKTSAYHVRCVRRF